MVFFNQSKMKKLINVVYTAVYFFVKKVMFVKDAYIMPFTMDQFTARYQNACDKIQDSITT